RTPTSPRGITDKEQWCPTKSCQTPISLRCQTPFPGIVSDALLPGKLGQPPFPRKRRRPPSPCQRSRRPTRFSEAVGERLPVLLELDGRDRPLRGERLGLAGELAVTLAELGRARRARRAARTTSRRSRSSRRSASALA